MNDKVGTINGQVIDGVVYLDSRDVVADLRRCADHATASAQAYGEPLSEHDFASALAWHTVAMALNNRADEIQFAVIAHQEDAPSEGATPSDG